MIFNSMRILLPVSNLCWNIVFFQVNTGRSESALDFRQNATGLVQHPLRIDVAVLAMSDRPMKRAIKDARRTESRLAFYA